MAMGTDRLWELPPSGDNPRRSLRSKYPSPPINWLPIGSWAVPDLDNFERLPENPWVITGKKPEGRSRPRCPLLRPRRRSDAAARLLVRVVTGSERLGHHLPNRRAGIIDQP